MTTVDTDGTTAGEDVFSYGNSSRRAGVEALSPKQGTSLGSDGGWTHPVYTVTPGVPGDSGHETSAAPSRAVSRAVSCPAGAGSSPPEQPDASRRRTAARAP